MSLIPNIYRQSDASSCMGKALLVKSRFEMVNFDMLVEKMACSYDGRARVRLVRIWR